MSIEKINEALKKITEEAGKLKDGDPCKLLISEYVMDKITTDAAAEKVLAEDKKLADLNKKMWDEAHKKKAGNGAHIPDADLMRMADEYYGFAAASGDSLDIDIAELLV
jgi:hypothetical protein